MSSSECQAQHIQYIQNVSAKNSTPGIVADFLLGWNSDTLVGCEEN